MVEVRTQGQAGILLVKKTLRDPGGLTHTPNQARLPLPSQESL